MNQYENGRNSGTGRSRARSTSYSGSGRSTSAGRQTRTAAGSGKGSASSSRSTSTRSTAGRGSSGSSVRRTSGNSRSASSRSGYYYNEARPSSSGRHGGRRGGPDFGKLAIGGVILILAIFCVTFLIKKAAGSGKADTEQETEITVPETELEKEVTVDGINITGMSRDEAKAAILKDFPWGNEGYLAGSEL